MPFTQRAAHSVAESTQGTPPHLPTYNVHLTPENIKGILTLVLPGRNLISCKQLESGKSFNNRIYFIETESRYALARPTQTQENFVLKLSGHYFGPRKVQNEVASLLLLENYCPDVPAPRLIAWSEDGGLIQNRSGGLLESGENVQAQSICPREMADSEHGWILMTQLPGRVLTKADLEAEHGPLLIKELARHLADWRVSMPDMSIIGNIRRSEPHDNGPSFVLSDTKNPGSGSPFNIGGLILCHQYSPEPLATPLSYYTYLAKDQLILLENTPQLRPLHAKIGKHVRSWIDKMPRVSFLQVSARAAQPVKFTHMDFAPRNILVSDTATQPYVTGVLDFEFAALMPFEEEFINMQVRQQDDWSAAQYSLLVNELASFDCEVPHMAGQCGEPVCTKATLDHCSCESRSFEGLSILVSVVDNIKPWFIQEGSHEDEELRREIDIAAANVLLGLEQLDRFIID